MERNVGETDQLVRIAAGALLVAIGTVLELAVEYALLGGVVAVAGVVTLVTGLTCRCGVYSLFGKSTRNRPE